MSDSAKLRGKLQTWAASCNNQLSNKQKTQNTQIQVSKRDVRNRRAMVTHLYISIHTHKVQDVLTEREMSYRIAGRD